MSWPFDEWSENGADVGLVYCEGAWNTVKGLCPRCGAKLRATEFDDGYVFDLEDDTDDGGGHVDSFECPSCGLGYALYQWSEPGPWSEIR